MGQVPFAHDVRAKTPELIPGTQRFDEGAFGGNAARGLGAGLESLGQGLAQAGDDIFRIQQRHWALDNETEANNALMQFSSNLDQLRTGNPDDPDDTGFLGLKGPAAAKAYPQMLSHMKDLQQQSLSGLANPAQREMFGRESLALMQRQANVFGAHALQQKALYQQEVTEAAIEQAHNYAAENYTDPLAVRQGLAKSIATLDTQLQAQGLTPDHLIYQQAQQDNRDAFFTKLARAQAGNKDAIGAFYTLLANRRHMSPPVFAQAQAGLKPLIEDEDAEGMANQVMGLDGEAPVIAPATASAHEAYKSLLRIEKWRRNSGKNEAPTGSDVTSGASSDANPDANPDANSDANSDGGDDLISKGEEGDVPVGVSQIRPSIAKAVAASHNIPFDEKRLSDDDAYNYALGEAGFNQLYQTYGNNAQLAAIAYKVGPARLDQWRKKFGDPLKGEISLSDFLSQIPDKETRFYANRVGADLGGRALPSDKDPKKYQNKQSARQTASYSDNQSASQQADFAYGGPVLEKYNDNLKKLGLGNDPDVADKTLVILHSRLSQDQARAAERQRKLTQVLVNLQADYRSGNVTQEIPEDEIKTTYGPKVAKHLIHNLSMDYKAGQLIKGIESDTPEEIKQARHDMQNLQGLIAQSNSKKNDPQNTVMTGHNESSEDVHYRNELASRFDELVKERNERLEKDPQAYVSALPDMQAKLEAAQSGDAQAVDDYNGASLLTQKRLGVTDPRLLTSEQTAQMAQQWRGLDIEKQDPIDLIAEWERQYGRYWPQVMGEMVRYGKLDGGFQILANADTPAQAVFRKDFVAALRMTPEQMKENLGSLSSEAKLLEGTDDQDIIDKQLEPFHQTVKPQAGGTELYAEVKQQVRRVAKFYLAHHDVSNAKAAVKRAINGVLNEKYDFSGTIRAPKGSLQAVKDVGSYWIKHALKASDLQGSGQPGSRPQDMIGKSADDTLNDIRRRGMLVINHDESGYNVVLPTRISNRYRVVYGKDDRPLTLSMEEILHPSFIHPNPNNDRYDRQANNIQAITDARKAAEAAINANPSIHEKIMKARYPKEKS